jgi:hypothetical protein
MSLTTENQNITRFLQSFYLQYTELHNKYARKELETIQIFINNIKLKLELLTHNEINESKNYNIFEILKIQSLEARFHSPFIANLLNPNGSHLMGRFFLDTFLIELGLVVDEPLGNWEFIDIQDEMVLTGGYGRADIFIKFRCQAQDFGIIIENKIYAGDQKNQLQKYYDYLRASGFPDERLKLYYLTPHGDSPSKESIKERERSNLIQNKILHEISYTKHIKNWLEECYKNRSLPTLIKGTIHQYIKTIKNI